MEFLSSTGTILQLIIGLGILIFVHELGHFLAAKWVGIKVAQFSIGFGHALIAYRKGIGFKVGTTELEFDKRVTDYLNKKNPDTQQNNTQNTTSTQFTSTQLDEAANALKLGETEYRFNWIPLGGYVKMEGQDDMDPTNTSIDPRAFNNKPIWARMCVISAGVIMNVIFGMIFFMLAFSIGVKFPPSQVGMVVPNSPAATTPATNHPDIVGLKPGDLITTINGKKTVDFTDIFTASALAGPDEIVNFQVERRDSPQSQPKLLTFDLKPVLSPVTNMLAVGIEPPNDLRLISQKNMNPYFEHLFNRFNLKPGWKLTQVNKQPVTALWQCSNIINESNNDTIQLTFTDKNNTTHIIDITPEIALNISDDIPNLLGLVPATIIRQVTENSPAQKAGLMPDDIITHISTTDDTLTTPISIAWPTLPEIGKAVIASNNTTLAITVLRDNNKLTLHVTPKNNLIGISHSWAIDHPYAARILDNSPFNQAQLTDGTLITAVNNTPVSSYTDIFNILRKNNSAAATVQAQLPLANDNLTTSTIQLTNADTATIANTQRVNPLNAAGLFMPFKILQQSSNPFIAAQMGFNRTGAFLKQTYITIARLFQRTVKVSNLSGPVGIAVGGSRFAKEGIAYLLFFMGLLSVNLAVINFLPFPIVDGGHAIMLIFEKLTGKPLPLAIQSWINMVGLTLLGAFFLFITYQDIIKFIIR